MQHEPGAGSENSIVPPGSCLTRASNAISNADAYSGDKTGSTGYRVTSEEETVLNAAHSIEKYPKD